MCYWLQVICYLSLDIVYLYVAVSNRLHTVRQCLLGYWLAAISPRGRCIIAHGEMEYIRAIHTLGINTPSQYGISNSFSIHWSFARVYIYFSHSFMMRRRMVFREIVC
jgi:hypothetical protein